MGGKVLELSSEKIYKEGWELGWKLGYFIATTEVILRDMKKLNMSFEETCDFYDIPAEEYEKYREAVEARQREAAEQSGEL